VGVRHSEHDPDQVREHELPNESQFLPTWQSADCALSGTAPRPLASAAAAEVPAGSASSPAEPREDALALLRRSLGRKGRLAAIRIAGAHQAGPDAALGSDLHVS